MAFFFDYITDWLRSFGNFVLRAEFQVVFEGKGETRLH